MGIFAIAPAMSQTITDWRGMDESKFVNLVQDSSVERIVFEPAGNAADGLI